MKDLLDYLAKQGPAGTRVDRIAALKAIGLDTNSWSGTVANAKKTGLMGQSDDKKEIWLIDPNPPAADDDSGNPEDEVTIH